MLVKVMLNKTFHGLNLNKTLTENIGEKNGNYKRIRSKGLEKMGGK